MRNVCFLLHLSGNIGDIHLIGLRHIHALLFREEQGQEGQSMDGRCAMFISVLTVCMTRQVLKIGGLFTRNQVRLSSPPASTTEEVDMLLLMLFPLKYRHG